MQKQAVKDFRQQCNKVQFLEKANALVDSLAQENGDTDDTYVFQKKIFNMYFEMFEKH